MYDKDYYEGKDSGYILSYHILRHPFFWRDEIRTIHKFKQDGKILDIGCAYGYFLNALGNKFTRYGIDISIDAVTEARRVVNCGIQFIQGSILDGNPFPGESFDIITLFNVIEHFENPSDVLMNLTGLIDKNGIIFLRFPFRNPPFCRDAFHYYRPLSEWHSIIRKNYSIIYEKTYFTLWGKCSTVRISPIWSNFVSLAVKLKDS